MMSRTDCSLYEELVAFDLESSAGGAIVVAGLDEAGRGALAGPVVAAAVICAPCEELREVRDSKLIEEGSREELYDLIKGRCTAFSTGIVENEEIDRVNILQATLKAMGDAVEALSSRPELVLVDGDRSPAIGVPCRAVIGGDGRSFAVAAASIVAKVTRDRIMRRMHDRWPLYGFTRNKGYATREHLDAIRRFDRCPLHRRSFRPWYP